MQGMRLRVLVRECLAREARDKEEARGLEVSQEKGAEPPTSITKTALHM